MKRFATKTYIYKIRKLRHIMLLIYLGLSYGILLQIAPEDCAAKCQQSYLIRKSQQICNEVCANSCAAICEAKRNGTYVPGKYGDSSTENIDQNGNFIGNRYGNFGGNESNVSGDGNTLRNIFNNNKGTNSINNPYFPKGMKVDYSNNPAYDKFYYKTPGADNTKSLTDAAELNKSINSILESIKSQTPVVVTKYIPSKETTSTTPTARIFVQTVLPQPPVTRTIHKTVIKYVPEVTTSYVERPPVFIKEPEKTLTITQKEEAVTTTQPPEIIQLPPTTIIKKASTTTVFKTLPAKTVSLPPQTVYSIKSVHLPAQIIVSTSIVERPKEFLTVYAKPVTLTQPATTIVLFTTKETTPETVLLEKPHYITVPKLVTSVETLPPQIVTQTMIKIIKEEPPKVIPPPGIPETKPPVPTVRVPRRNIRPQRPVARRIPRPQGREFFRPPGNNFNNIGTPRYYNRYPGPGGSNGNYGDISGQNNGEDGFKIICDPKTQICYGTTIDNTGNGRDYKGFNRRPGIPTAPGVPGFNRRPVQGKGVCEYPTNKPVCIVPGTQKQPGGGQYRCNPTQINDCYNNMLSGNFMENIPPQNNNECSLNKLENCSYETMPEIKPVKKDVPKKNKKDEDKDGENDSTKEPDNAKESEEPAKESASAENETSEVSAEYYSVSSSDLTNNKNKRSGLVDRIASLLPKSSKSKKASNLVENNNQDSVVYLSDVLNDNQ